MPHVKVFAGMESGHPFLEFRNDRTEPVTITSISFMRDYWNDTGASSPCHQSVRIEVGQSHRMGGQGLVDALGRVFLRGETEAVLRIRVDLSPPEAESDQPPPSFYVVRRQNDQFTEFYSLTDSLRAEPSAFDTLIESHRRGG